MGLLTVRSLTHCTMSRLDYITIAIVALCILAILFLVYKMTDLFTGKETKDKIENVTAPVEEEDDMYDYEIDNAIDSAGTATSDEAGGTQPSTTTPATAQPGSKVLDASSSPSETDGETTTSQPVKATSSGGKFMVLAGSFKLKASADREAQRLRSKGYTNASVEIFDRGKYAVILVDRFNNMAEAERLVKKLSQDKVESYVKIKEAH